MPGDAVVSNEKHAARIREIKGRIVHVPMRRPLSTSAGMIHEAPLLLVDVHTEEGPVGHSYAFCYGPGPVRATIAVLQDLAPSLAGHALVPHMLRKTLAARFRLVGHRGVVSLVASALDMAVWDALSKEAGLPLACMLGAAPIAVKAYNSNGLGLVSPLEAAEEALELVQGGFQGVKMRLGRREARADFEAVVAVRKALPDSVALMGDFNQALTPAEALVRCSMLDDQGLLWIEEPLPHDDHANYRRLRSRIKTPIQMGENFISPHSMMTALAGGCTDYVMPDVERIGGVSGWIDAASLAASHNIEMSSHLFPEISAHLLAATPTCHWLEYVDWADPILNEPLQITDGMATANGSPGTGISWNEDAVGRYLAN
jgi:mandelate racemase